MSPRAESCVGCIQQPDRRFERRRTQVHVPLRRRQVLMPGQLLNRPRRRAPHRQVRTERVPQDVNARASRCARRAARRTMHLHDLLRERLPVAVDRAPARPRRCRCCPQRLRQPHRQRHVPQPPAFRRRHVALPLGPLPRRAAASSDRRRVHSSAIISPHRSPASPPSSTIRCVASVQSLGRLDQPLVRRRSRGTAPTASASAAAGSCTASARSRPTPRPSSAARSAPSARC